MIIPAVQRISPQLSGSRKSVRRASCHRKGRALLIKLEQLGIRPGIRAVKSYIDRNITDNTDSVFIGIIFQLFPLCAELILLKTDELDFLSERFSLLLQDFRLSLL